MLDLSTLALETRNGMYFHPGFIWLLLLFWLKHFATVHLKLVLFVIICLEITFFNIISLDKKICIFILSKYVIHRRNTVEKKKKKHRRTSSYNNTESN